MKNRLSHVWLLCLMVAIGLLSLRYLPDFSVFGKELRPVDFLSDILDKPTNPKAAILAHIDGESVDSTAIRDMAQQPMEQPKTTDGLALPVNPIPIEDFSGDHSAMTTFYNALKRLPESSKSIHVAFMGDSFVEGDLLTDKLRDTLQQVFGGMGVGFVPFASPSTNFRTTIIQNTSGFHTASAVDSGRTGKVFGVSGHLAIPVSEQNNITYHGIRNQPALQLFKDITLYYSSSRQVDFSYKPNNGNREQGRFTEGKGLQAFSIAVDSAKNISFSFSQDSLLKLYGLNFENGKGVYIDNFSLRGNAGFALFRTAPEMYRQSDSLMNYKLIVVQYGLNALNRKVKNYDHYKKTLVSVINHLKAGFPNSSILVIGIGDRSERRDGEYVTMESLPNLIEAQRSAALETGVAFWDMQRAMGGENSMARFVNHEPALANKDYTHINRRGGEVIARQLAKSLLQGFNTQ